MAIPLSKTSELVSQLNSYIEHGEPVDAFTLRRWQREADTMLKNPELRAEGFAAHGILAAFQLDGEAVHHYFRQAMDEELSFQVLTNYMVALGNCFLPEDGYQVMKDIQGTYGEDYPFLNVLLLRQCFDAGHLREGLDIIALYGQEIVDMLPVGSAAYASDPAAHELGCWMAENDVPDQSMVDLFSIANQLLGERRVTPPHNSISHLDDEGFLIKYFVRCSVDDAIDMNIEFSERSVEVIDPRVREAVSVYFLPMDEDS